MRDTAKADHLARIRAAHDAITDEEDAELRSAALSDSDNPPREGPPPPRRGRPRLDRPKQDIKIRLDADVVDRLRAGGPGWQTRINSTLREALKMDG